MEDLMTYRMRIGTFAGAATVPAVIKRSRSMIRKLKRRRRPIKDLHVKMFLCLGFIFLLVSVCARSLYLCAPSYNDSVGYISLSNEITSIEINVNYTTIVSKMVYYNISSTQSFVYQTSVLQQYNVHLPTKVTGRASMKVVTLPDSQRAHIPTMYKLSYLDYIRSSTVTRTMPMDGSILSLNDNNTHLDSLALSTDFKTFLRIGSALLPTMIRLLHMNFAHELSIISFVNIFVILSTKKKLINLDSLMTLIGGAGRCDYLLGNKGIHSYNGNMKREESPTPGSDYVIYDLHYKMVTDLDNLIAPSKNEILNVRWKKFTSHLQRPDLLSAVEIYKLKDMYDVFDNLLSKGKVNYGKYDTVKKILSNLTLIQCLDIVTQCEEDIKVNLEDSKKAKKQKTEATVEKGTTEIIYSRNATYPVSSWDTKETEYSRDTSATEPKDMPSVMNTYIQTLSEEERAIYDNSLKDGKETYRHIRVLYVGDFGVGKTTLFKNITRKDVDIGNEPSTDGAEVFTQICEVLLGEKNEWKILDDDYEEKENVIAKRIANVTVSSAPEMTESIENESPITEGMQKSEGCHVKKRDSTIENKGDCIETNVGNIRNEKDDDIKFINQCVKEKKENPSKKAFVSMWDFAGQEDYYSTHHVFFSSHAVFVLVCDAQKCLEGTEEEKKLARDKITFWLRSIKTYSKSDSEHTTTGKPSVDKVHSPPIIFVGTHADKLQVNDDDQFYELPIELTQEKCEDIDIFRTLLVDNSKGHSDEIKSLKSFIVEAAEYQDQWEKLIPAKWLTLERCILMEREKGVKVLTFKDLIELNKKNQVPLNTEDEVNIFLRYLHSSRTVIFFGEDEILSRKVIINSQWLLDAFKCLISNKCFVEKTHTAKYSLWKKLRNTAKLTDKLIDCAWEKEHSFMENKDVLVAVLERFGLISLPLNLPPDSDKYYFVPHLLKDPDLPSFKRFIESESRQHKHPSLSLYLMFREQNLPQDIYDRLLSSFISFYKLDAKDTKGLEKCVKRGFGFFKFDYHCSFIILCRHSFISLTLFCDDDPHKITTDQGMKLRKETERMLSKICKMNRKTEFEFNHAFCCEYDVEDPIPLKEFNDNITSIRCPCKRKHYIKQTDLQIWGFKTKNAAEDTEEPKMDPGRGSTQVTNYSITVQGNMTTRDMFSSTTTTSHR